MLLAVKLSFVALAVAGLAVIYVLASEPDVWAERVLWCGALLSGIIFGFAVFAASSEIVMFLDRVL